MGFGVSVGAVLFRTEAHFFMKFFAGISLFEARWVGVRASGQGEKNFQSEVRFVRNGER
jgi:hypothetical protein